MQARLSFTPGMSGMIGYEPAAMIILSAVYSLSSTFTVFVLINLAFPSTRVILLSFIRAFTPEVSFSTTEARKPCTFSQSTRTSAPTMPIAALPVAASYISEVCSIAFVGIQPRLRQVPPTWAFSISVTFAPNCAALIAAV